MGFATTALNYGRKVSANLNKSDDSGGGNDKSQLKDIGGEIRKGLKKINKYSSGKG